MTPYLGFLLQPLVDILDGFTEGINDSSLWSAVIETVTKSCLCDEGGTHSVLFCTTFISSANTESVAFWREDKLRQLIAPLLAQVPNCVAVSELRDSLRECLVALAEVINDPSSLKSLNLEILMHTRSDDARMRIYALTCDESLWQAHGGKLIGECLQSTSVTMSLKFPNLGFAPDTATFIAECAEDENDSVVREAHRLKNAVESIAGRLNV